jgi:NADH-quinone oxidoreductase subunit G
MNEVPKEPQLGVFGRGSHEVIDVFPGAELTSNYAGNTVDICPVGALLNRDFRFRARTWFLSTNPSVCTGCSRGCNTYNDFFGQDTYRYRPRENEQVNKSWMCDQGRLSYKYLNVARSLHPTIGRGGADLREASVVEAAKEAMSKLKPLAGTAGLAVMASPLLSNEELLAGLTFAKDVLKVSSVYVGGRPEGQGDHFLMTADKNPNRKGLEWIAAGLGLSLKPASALVDAMNGGQVKALYALGTESPVGDETLAAACQRLELLVAHTFNLNLMTAAAHVVLPITTHVEDEGSFVNLDGITQRFRRAYLPKGEAQPVWKWVSALYDLAGVATRYESAREVFLKHKGSVSAWAQFEWDGSAPKQTRRRGISPMPAAADGRPPGYREFGV